MGLFSHIIDKVTGEEQKRVNYAHNYMLQILNKVSPDRGYTYWFVMQNSVKFDISQRLQLSLFLDGCFYSLIGHYQEEKHNTLTAQKLLEKSSQVADRFYMEQLNWTWDYLEHRASMIKNLMENYPDRLSGLMNAGTEFTINILPYLNNNSLEIHYSLGMFDELLDTLEIEL
jgi:hypothetical protein